VRPDAKHPGLRKWLDAHGLKDATLLGVFETEWLDSLNPQQRRFLHGLLNAFYELEHSDRQEQETKED